LRAMAGVVSAPGCARTGRRLFLFRGRRSVRPVPIPGARQRGAVPIPGTDHMRRLCPMRRTGIRHRRCYTEVEALRACGAHRSAQRRRPVPIQATACLRRSDPVPTFGRRRPSRPLSRSPGEPSGVSGRVPARHDLADVPEHAEVVLVPVIDRNRYLTRRLLVGHHRGLFLFDAAFAPHPRSSVVRNYARQPPHTRPPGNGPAAPR
jgi:hypothetical protein